MYFQMMFKLKLVHSFKKLVNGLKKLNKNTFNYTIITIYKLFNLNI